MEDKMKRIFALSSVIALVLVMAVAAIAWADDAVPGYGPSPSYGDCPAGEFIDEDGDGVCDNAPRDGNVGPNERRGMMQQGRTAFGRDMFSRFGDGPMNGSGPMGHHGTGHQGAGHQGAGPNFVDADGDGVCDNFVDEDGDGINDNAPRDGTGNRMGRRGSQAAPKK